MRILLIHKDGLEGTGSATYAGILIRALREKHEVKSLSSISDLDRNWDIVHVLDIKHFDPTLLNKLSSKGGMASPEGGGRVYNNACSSVRKSMPPRLIVDVHDAHWAPGEPFYPVPDWPLRKYLALKRRRKYMPILDRADGVIVHSKYVASRLAKWKPHVVPYAVKSCRRDIPVPQHLPDRNVRPPAIVFAGRDYFRKGITVLHKAWRHVSVHHPGARLFIAGREFAHGRLYANWMARDKTVTALGGIGHGELMELMGNARAVVLPSWTESFGIVLIEAMALGTAAIGSAVGGIGEALNGGEGGILFPPGDHRALANAILTCLAGDGDVPGMIERGVKIAGDYSIEAMINSVEDIYSEVS